MVRAQIRAYVATNLGALLASTRYFLWCIQHWHHVQVQVKVLTEGQRQAERGKRGMNDQCTWAELAALSNTKSTGP